MILAVLLFGLVVLVLFCALALEDTHHDVTTRETD